MLEVPPTPLEHDKCTYIANCCLDFDKGVEEFQAPLEHYKSCAVLVSVEDILLFRGAVGGVTFMLFAFYDAPTPTPQHETIAFEK